MSTSQNTVGLVGASVIAGHLDLAGLNVITPDGNSSAAISAQKDIVETNLPLGLGMVIVKASADPDLQRWVARIAMGNPTAKIIYLISDHGALAAPPLFGTALQLPSTLNDILEALGATPVPGAEGQTQIIFAGEELDALSVTAASTRGASSNGSPTAPSPLPSSGWSGHDQAQTSEIVFHTQELDSTDAAGEEPPAAEEEAPPVRPLRPGQRPDDVPTVDAPAPALRDPLDERPSWMSEQPTPPPSAASAPRPAPAPVPPAEQSEPSWVSQGGFEPLPRYDEAAPAETPRLTPAPPVVEPEDAADAHNAVQRPVHRQDFSTASSAGFVRQGEESRGGNNEARVEALRAQAATRDAWSSKIPDVLDDDEPLLPSAVTAGISWGQDASLVTGGRRVRHGKVIMLFSKTGGQGKTAAALALSRMASQKGLKVALVDADMGQGSASLYLGTTQETGDTVRDAERVVTIYDAAERIGVGRRNASRREVEDALESAVIPAEELKYLRTQSDRSLQPLDINYSFVSAATPEQMRTGMVTAQIYKMVIEYLTKMNDLVIVDMGILKVGPEDAGITHNLIAPLLAKDAWMVAVTSMERASVESIIKTLNEMRMSKSMNTSRILGLMTKVESDEEDSALETLKAFGALGVKHVGFTSMDKNVRRAMNQGMLDISLPAIDPPLMQILRIVTERDEFDLVAEAIKNAKPGFFSRIRGRKKGK